MSRRYSCFMCARKVDVGFYFELHHKRDNRLHIVRICSDCSKWNDMERIKEAVDIRLNYIRTLERV